MNLQFQLNVHVHVHYSHSLIRCSVHVLHTYMTLCVQVYQLI